MLPSSIQLKDLAYIGVKVWPQPLKEPKEGEVELREPFDFNGVVIGENIELRKFDAEGLPLVFGVKLRITINNKEGKVAPYDIDVEVAGMFEVLEKVPVEKREELVLVNGCAMLFGAIRDQVMSISSRSTQGVLILPTVNFLDRVKKEEVAASTS